MPPPPKGPAQMTGRLVGRAVESIRHTEGVEMGRYNQGVPPHPRDQRGDRHVWPIQVTGSDDNEGLWPAKIRYWQSYSDPTHTFADWPGAAAIWAIVTPGGDDLTNTAEYLAVFVGVHTDGKAVFEVVGGGATSPPPSPPFTPTNWSTTVDGYMTAADQTGAGRKTSEGVAAATGGGGWVAVARETSGAIYSLPYQASLIGDTDIADTFTTYTELLPGSFGGTPEHADIDPDSAVTVWSAANIGQELRCTFSLFNADSDGDMVLAVGDGRQLGTSTRRFGVWRATGGVSELHEGIDGDGSACTIAEIVGGIVVGLTTPDTASPADSDYFIFCASGVAKKVTLADLASRVAEINASVPPPPP